MNRDLPSFAVTLRAIASHCMDRLAEAIGMYAVGSVTLSVRTGVFCRSASVIQDNLFRAGFPQAERAIRASRALAIASDAQCQMPGPDDGATGAPLRAKIAGLAKFAITIDGNVRALKAGLMSAVTRTVGGAGGPE